MLVLERKPGEKVVIDGGRVVVVVLRARGDGKVRLGVQADRSIAVDREEIHDRRERRVRHG